MQDLGHCTWNSHQHTKLKGVQKRTVWLPCCQKLQIYPSLALASGLPKTRLHYQPLWQFQAIFRGSHNSTRVCHDSRSLLHDTTVTHTLSVCTWCPSLSCRTKLNWSEQKFKVHLSKNHCCLPCSPLVQKTDKIMSVLLSCRTGTCATTKHAVTFVTDPNRLEAFHLDVLQLWQPPPQI